MFLNDVPELSGVNLGLFPFGSSVSADLVSSNLVVMAKGSGPLGIKCQFSDSRTNESHS